MKKLYAIPIILGVSIVLLAVQTSFLPLQQQFAYGTVPALKKPANPAGAPAGNMTGTPSANTTAGPSATPPANPAGVHVPCCPPGYEDCDC